MLEGMFKTAGYMQNRELSWLKFNERVLLEANRTEMPLLERLKFISIFCNNLDEFFMIRVGSLNDSLLLANKLTDSKTGMTVKEQLNEIYRTITPLYKLVDHAYSTVISELENHGVELLKMEDLSPSELKTMKNHFTYNVLPLLTPTIIDAKHPFPHIPNKQLHIAVIVQKKRSTAFGLIAVPQNLDRVINIDETHKRFVLLEDLILYFTELAFSNFGILEKVIIAVTRNADFDTAEDLLDEDIDFRQYMKSLLKKRQRLAAVRLEVTKDVSPELLGFLCSKLNLKSSQVFHINAPPELSFGFTFNRFLSKEITEPLLWRLHVPAYSLSSEATNNMLKRASGKDILLSYPFDSITPFLSLIRQAAEHPSVVSIKITLYRIDSKSQLAESLIRAAENGKDVLVLMELRARFDESNNIEWASRMEEAGCRVIYGLVGYKCHSKMCLITRKESGKLNYITQIGTGNYNEKTAKLYTDLSLITSNQEIGQDAAAFFSNMFIENLEGEYKHLWVAPNSFKNNVLDAIENERKKAQRGELGKIFIKCNSLTDKEIIEKLVEAGDDGVEIVMNIRGICCLIPGLPGVTDNIKVFSVVGKFLEHTRIFCFGVGDDVRLYISSADLMTRNTQRRVEVACPILDPDVRNQILWMIDIMQSDDTNSWLLQPDGKYFLTETVDLDSPKSSQMIFTAEAQNRGYNFIKEHMPLEVRIFDQTNNIFYKLFKKIKSMF
ncbi:MAG: polyphosphate kinase 1 [Oscillospiraceae bacterium]|jgi:polyphosphate kinase|nr:polyphosphate kinase 1 [Oscillospiraceae bacterium]